MKKLLFVFCFMSLLGMSHGLRAQTIQGDFDENYSPYLHRDGQRYHWENDEGYLDHRAQGGLDDFDQRGSFREYDRHGHETDFYFNQTGDIEYIFH